MSPEIQLVGIHPRSEKLIELTRSYERAKASWSQVEVQLGQETKEVIKLQESLGFRHFSDGCLGWQDQLRPVTLSLKGVESGTRYSRWFDTNTFYQKPVVVGKISAGNIDPKNFLRAELLTGTRDRKITLPGPYTFSQLSENKHYENHADLLLDIALAEREIIRKLKNQGVTLFQLSEPCLVYQPYREKFRDKSEVELALRAIRSLVKDSPGEFVVQTYFGDAAPLLPELLDLPIFGIGIDLFETDISSLSEEERTSKALVLGVVDSRESFVENPRWIADTARKFSEKVDAHDLVFAPNSDLKFVPQKIANQKCEALSKASELFEGS
jgi:5-methyltetrahydropteroyltriglutamate--homocysteine methyltransferase